MAEVEGSFLRIAALKKWDRFHRFQDISPEQFVSVGAARYAKRSTVPLYGTLTFSSNYKTSGAVHYSPYEVSWPA